MNQQVLVESGTLSPAEKTLSRSIWFVLAESREIMTETRLYMTISREARRSINACPIAVIKMSLKLTRTNHAIFVIISFVYWCMGGTCNALTRKWQSLRRQQGEQLKDIREPHACDDVEVSYFTLCRVWPNEFLGEGGGTGVFSRTTVMGNKSSMFGWPCMCVALGGGNRNEIGVGLIKPLRNSTHTHTLQV